jgi:hypothetical protein
LAPAACVAVGAALLVDPLLLEELDDDDEDEASVFESDPQPVRASPRATRATAAPPAVV